MGTLLTGYFYAILLWKQQKWAVLMNIGIVEENIKLRKWYEANGAEHIGTKKFDFFPFTCGYMRKEI